MHESESATTIIKGLWGRVAKLHKEKYGFVEPIFSLGFPQILDKVEATVMNKLIKNIVEVCTRKIYQN